MYGRRKSFQKISSELYIMQTEYIVIRTTSAVIRIVLWHLYVYYGQWSDGGPKEKQRYLVCIVLWWRLLTNEKVALDDRRISTSKHTLS